MAYVVKETLQDVLSNLANIKQCEGTSDVPWDALLIFLSITLTRLNNRITVCMKICLLTAFWLLQVSHLLLLLHCCSTALQALCGFICKVEYMYRVSSKQPSTGFRIHQQKGKNLNSRYFSTFPTYPFLIKYWSTFIVSKTFYQQEIRFIFNESSRIANLMLPWYSSLLQCHFLFASFFQIFSCWLRSVKLHICYVNLVWFDTVKICIKESTNCNKVLTEICFLFFWNLIAA